MSHFTRPVLVMFTSSPGSGKSYFARQAAERMNAVRLSSDAMRVAMFGSVDSIHKAYDQIGHEQALGVLFGAMDYATEQSLAAGNDVFYDANNNKREHRSTQEERAARHGALSVVVQLDVPYEVALKRGQERENTPDQRRKTEEEMKELIERIQSNTDQPGEDENTVTLDGQAPFDQQFADFEGQVEEIINRG